jgi:hypothetical protein
MLDWMLEEPIDEVYEDDCKLSVEYDQFMNENCKCGDECECMTFEEFKDMKIEEYWESYDIETFEELYG